MRRIILRKFVVFVAVCSTMLLQVQPTLAADLPERISTNAPIAAPPEALDAVIQSDGSLNGVVVDERGMPSADATVKMTRLTFPRSATVTVNTDREGHFQVADVRGGVYSFQAGDSTNVYRLWTDGSQPPAAAPRIRLVRNTQRSEVSSGGLSPRAWACIGVGVAAAIAAPIALSQHHSPASGN